MGERKEFAKLGGCDEWGECVELSDGTKFSVDLLWTNKKKVGPLTLSEEPVVKMLNAAYESAVRDRVRPLVEALRDIGNSAGSPTAHSQEIERKELHGRMNFISAIVQNALKEFPDE